MSYVILETTKIEIGRAKEVEMERASYIMHLLLTEEYCYNIVREDFSMCPPFRNNTLPCTQPLSQAVSPLYVSGLAVTLIHYFL